MSDSWESFRDRHLAHMRDAVGFDERSATWALWDQWRSREAARITREALAEARPEGVSTHEEKRSIARREAERRARLDASGLIGVGPQPAPGKWFGRD